MAGTTTTETPVSLSEARTYLTLSGLTGARLPASYLIAHAKQLAWRPALTLLGRVAAVLANEGGAESAATLRVTLGELLKYPAANDAEIAVVEVVRHHLRSRRTPPIVAHDGVVYFLQALVLQHGGEAGRAPSLAELAFLMLIANDHLDEHSAAPISETEPTIEELATVLCHQRKFNRQHDMVCVIARAAAMFEQPPDDRLVPGDPEWLASQRAAFDGLTFAEHFDSYIAPLVLISKTWGGLGDAEAKDPLLPRRTWFSGAAISDDDGRRFLDSLSMERGEIAGKIPVRPDGLPGRPIVFFRSPLVRLSDDTTLCLSPRLIQEQLELGLWAKFRTAKAGRWVIQFGAIFELWARRVARGAGDLNPRLQAQLEISARMGTEEEIEDVVVKDARNAVLFSVKGAVLREDVAHHASVEETIAWYERFLFQPPDPADRRDHPGAVVKLEAKIKLIRAGRYPAIAPDSYVMPVIVVFGSLHENPALYKWIERRCKERGLLQDGRTAPLCLATIDDFEYLMAMGARGQSLIQVMRNKPVSTWRHRNLDAMLYELAGRDGRLRLPFLAGEYDRIIDRSIKRLFPHGHRATQGTAGTPVGP